MAYNEQSTERQRFRSFCERYLIARAEFFTKGREEEDAFACMLQANAIYKRLNAYSAHFEKREEPQDAQGSAVANQAGGITGPQQAPSLPQALQAAVKSGALSPQAAMKALSALRGLPTP